MLCQITNLNNQNPNFFHYLCILRRESQDSRTKTLEPAVTQNSKLLTNN